MSTTYSVTEYYSQGLDLEWCKNPEKGLLVPDVVLFLDLDPDVAASRKDFGQEKYEKLEFQKKVRGVFKQLLEKEQNTLFIDADKGVPELHEQMLQAVKLYNAPSTPLKFDLWK